MARLNIITDLVQYLLHKYPETRNSDNVLYYFVLKDLGREKGIDIEHMSLPNFLLHMKEYGLPSIETVGRCRRKVVECHPELAGKDQVEGMRTAKEEEFKEYSRQVFV